jgi:hypothetical protein
MLKPIKRGSGKRVWQRRDGVLVGLSVVRGRWSGEQLMDWYVPGEVAVWALFPDGAAEEKP